MSSSRAESPVAMPRRSTSKESPGRSIARRDTAMAGIPRRMKSGWTITSASDRLTEPHRRRGAGRRCSPLLRRSNAGALRSHARRPHRKRAAVYSIAEYRRPQSLSTGFLAGRTFKHGQGTAACRTELGLILALHNNNRAPSLMWTVLLSCDCGAK